jgi:hypothetical protein
MNQESTEKIYIVMIEVWTTGRADHYKTLGWVRATGPFTQEEAQVYAKNVNKIPFTSTKSYSAEVAELPFKPELEKVSHW